MKNYFEIIENVNENDVYYFNGQMIYDDNVYDNDEIDGNVEYGTWISEW